MAAMEAIMMEVIPIAVVDTLCQRALRTPSHNMISKSLTDEHFGDSE